MLVASWSGGKDSCLALARAQNMGLEVRGLVNFISDDYRRVRFHGTEAALIEAQARLMGLPLYQRETAADSFEEGFRQALSECIEKGATGMVFGDIYLQPHRDWVERICADLGIEALEPLWGEPTEKLYREFVDLGFRSVLVGGMKEHIEPEWMGRELDVRFMEDFKRKNPDGDVCGENGEFHSFVVGGPLLHGEIRITKSEVMDKGDFWFFDIQRYEIV